VCTSRRASDKRPPKSPHSAESSFRHAQARRNHCEALNGAIKLGRKLNLESADRTHTPFERTIDALLSLALMTKTAFALADQRNQHGLYPQLPPPPLADTLAL
jgi:hypothetical protein